MPRNTIDEMIAILQAHKEGKTMECRTCWDAKGTWMAVSEPVFSFSQTEYRIKQEPIRKKKLYQFLCQDEGVSKMYFITANMSETVEQCAKIYKYCKVLKRLDHTMIEVEEKG